MKAKSYTLNQFGKVITMLLVAVSLTFTACEKEEGEVIQDIAIELTFKDSAGNDLLDAKNPHAFSTNNIDLYYLTNGKQERVFDGKMDYPKQFFVFQTGSQHVMRLFPSLDEENMRTQTYLKLNETDTDTISCIIKRWGKSNQSVAVTKVWYNNELVWEGAGPRYVEIVK
ncbi:hypothetical protein Q4E40_11150 [Pontibacter sp. BT731]|uniref:hypothetical protein n=1 Tax=Pontibacter coccineus TaxID=3063328 RepID=UPI0026E409F5|nr:hypothetical protein [Pontibacter sp. BT731]MDO6390684.1 hypothetical protein [Pontibacter sp. BT731]